LVPAYDVDEHARNERLHMASEAYARQFRKDFTLYLELRAKELVQGGRMVVSLVGKNSDDRTSQFLHLWEMFAKILCAMASEVPFQFSISIYCF
jgi:jasmonate O-methyltransferase